MSTKLTIIETPAPAMVDSRALQLALGVRRLGDLFTQHVASDLVRRGFADVTASRLGFLSALDCGVNTGAAIARRLNVSRQMVSKTVHELAQAGLLEQQDNPERRNQKIVLFTRRGEELMVAARRSLAALDARLAMTFDMAELDRLQTGIDRLSACLEEMDADRR
jgi:DNA-binding MarR family transcriptional regulator